jgi:hypothetical protein
MKVVVRTFCAVHGRNLGPISIKTKTWREGRELRGFTFREGERVAGEREKLEIERGRLGRE